MKWIMYSFERGVSGILVIATFLLRKFCCTLLHARGEA